MSADRRPSRGSDPASLRAPSLREESSKSTPSTIDATDASSSGQTQHTPRTPFTPTTQSPAQPQAQAYFRVPASPHPGIMPSGEPNSKQAKVAIPRLKRSLDFGEGGAKPGGRHRVTHACEPCRHRKTKCSGERPSCRHCQDFKIHCYYADGKRDRVKKQFGTMQDKVSEYERILRDISTRVSDIDADLIKTTLERTAQLDVEDVATEHGTSVAPTNLELDVEESGAESEVSGGAGSTGALDRTEEDFTRDAAKTTGFMGKNSDVTWLQRLRQENKFGEGTSIDDSQAAHIAAASAGPSFRPHRTKASTNIPLPEADQGFTIQDSSYHLNDLAISTYEAVDAYELPTTDHARKLFNTYMHRVHPFFPIVGRINLQTQFFKFLTGSSVQPPPKWLAIVNLIFAISAKYSHLIQAEWQADERDHIIYFTRARMLAIDNDTILNHSDLQMIQIFGLMSFYLLCTDQVNRAWNIVGMAVRMATGLGMNMRNDSADLSNSLKEIRYRVWWALYTLEHRLCTMTGRVVCIMDDHCTTPLPIPVDEDEFESELGKRLLSQEHQTHHRAPSSNAHTPSMVESTPSSRSGSKIVADEARSPSIALPAHNELEWAKDARPTHALFFLHFIQLSRLTQLVFQKLYNPAAMEGHWSDVQRQIGNLNLQLENWHRKLPAAFDFRRKQRDRDFYDARLALGFFYYATKQMLHRPCLCRLDRKIPDQSEKSNEFNRAAATTCVISAQELLSLIPDEPNAVGLLRVGPWTSILHTLVQSASVLMLEISFRAHHMPEQADDLLESSKKVVRWLHALGEDNLAAARAWQLCNQMLDEAATKIGRRIEDMPQHPPRAAVPADDDASMSSGTVTQQPTYQHGQGQSRNYMSQTTTPATTMGIAEMSGYGPPAFFDPMVHSGYDQYYPSGIDPAQMQFNHNVDGIQYGQPTNAEMNFMNQYTEHSDLSSNPGAHRGGRSGYG